MKSIFFTTFLAILFLVGCASSNSNLDELDRMELQDEAMISGQAFQMKQITGKFCANPNY